MKNPDKQFIAVLQMAGILLVCLFVASEIALAEETLDFDVDQLIANEKAWSSEVKSSEFATRPIEITLVGANTDKGYIHVFAYDNALAFRTGDYENAVGYLKIGAAPGPITASLNVASTEKIAIFVYHDENSDDVLNKRNQIPEEAYGFSGGVNPYLQPSFDEASFSKESITIRLISITTR